MSPAPGAAPRFRLVTFDLDGTLTTVHGWRVIAAAVGREQEYERSQRRFFAREIGEDEHLKNLLDLAVGRTLDELTQILSRVPRVDGIQATVDQLHARGIGSALLTHNPSYICDWYRRTFGFDDAEGTEGTVIEGGRVVDSGPAKAAKVEGLYRLLRRRAVGAAAVVHVGDGWADAEIFPRVGGGVALNSRHREVERKADAVLRTTTLTDLLPVLERLPGRSPMEGA